MSPPKNKQVEQKTIGDAISERLQAAGNYDPNNETRPAAILWPDEKEEWKTVISYFRSKIPHLLTFGEYDPAQKKGPAIWLKCAVEGELKRNSSQDAPPVIYMPGISRHKLRDVEKCPDLLKPLVELQYRGKYWTQKNCRDWTVYAFLKSSNGGLNLDVSDDSQTKEAINNALLEVLETPVENLTGRRLEAHDFHNLLSTDSRRALLSWINNPDKFKKRQTENKWEAFRETVRSEYNIDPEKDGFYEAAKKLGQQKGNWKEVWKRFREAPENFAKIPEKLRQAQPDEQTERVNDSREVKTSGIPGWPQVNERLENEIKTALQNLEKENFDHACDVIEQLEQKHSNRRNSVWSKLGLTPFADLLLPLSFIAENCERELRDSSFKDFADDYTEFGWKMDRAVIETLDAIYGHTELSDLTVHLLRRFYGTWVRNNAEKFQQLTKEEGYPEITLSDNDRGTDGTAFLFVDARPLPQAPNLLNLQLRRTVQIIATLRIFIQQLMSQAQN
jgi:hypothetical protein